MLNVLMFILGIAVILVLARYNQSNKLFWTLLIAMMAGFAGGSIAAGFASNSDDSSKHAGLYQTMPTQGLIPQITKAAMPMSTEDLNIHAIAKPVGKVEFGIKPVDPNLYQSNLTTIVEINRTNPGIAMRLFDTS